MFCRSFHPRGRCPGRLSRHLLGRSPIFPPNHPSSLPEAVTVVETGSDLARLASLSKLHPSLAVVASVLNAIASNRARLSQEASESLYSLISETTKQTSLSASQMQQDLANSLRISSEQERLGLMEAISQVADIAEMNRDHKSKLLISITEGNSASRQLEIKAATVAQLAITAAIGLPAIILAVGQAIEASRPRWHESAAKSVESIFAERPRKKKRRK